MAALLPEESRAMRDAVSRQTPEGGYFSAKWRDLHDQAARLAVLADLSPEPFAGEVAAFPGRMEPASQWLRDLAWQGVEDMDAMMRPGLAALATLKERGAPTNAPALALWCEFYNARGAILALAERSQAELA
jgi:hypothetical protein